MIRTALWNQITQKPRILRFLCRLYCVSVCSVIKTKNKRLLEHVASRNTILHKSQIGFLPKNRTADHVFTLRTSIDKYVNNHDQKIYARFVEFRKAFDSVWHNGLLNKLLQLNVGGCFYSLINPLSPNSDLNVISPHNITH